MYTNDELAHHGIQGQRWGIRRFQNKDGSLTSAGKKRYSSDYDRYHEDYRKAHSKKSYKEMSDAELRSVNNRLQMEKQYKQLSSTEIRGAKKSYSDALKIAGGVVALTSTGLALYNNYSQIKKIIKK